MLDQWLTYGQKNPNPYCLFRVIDITEKGKPDVDFIGFLGTELLNSYRNLKELKFRYENSDKRELFLNNLFSPFACRFGASCHAFWE
jgi:hypothetical protein